MPINIHNEYPYQCLSIDVKFCLELPSEAALLESFGLAVLLAARLASLADEDLGDTALSVSFLGGGLLSSCASALGNNGSMKQYTNAPAAEWA